MATEQEAKQVYVRRNLPRLVREVTFSELAAQLNAGDKQRVLRATQNGNKKVLFDTLRKAVERQAQANGETEVDGFLANGSITLAELDGWL